MSSKETSKKPGLISRFFSSGSSRSDEEVERSKKRLQRLHSVDVTTFRDRNSSGLFDGGEQKKRDLKAIKEEGDRSRRKQSVPVASTSFRADPKPARSQRKAEGPKRKTNRHRKKGPGLVGVQVDVSKPLEYPTTPEMIYEYHRRKPFLDKNEEWLVMELNQYECLVDSLEVIKIIAKHSKFFEVEPDELWEEFFEYMEEVPSYDEIINYDVWQEFRDNKYPC